MLQNNVSLWISLSRLHVSSFSMRKFKVGRRAARALLFPKRSHLAVSVTHQVYSIFGALML